MTNIKETPMMGQYMKFKRQYPDKIVLFRMGDFFETFGDDAKLTSKILNITLTTRDKSTNPTPLAGFPHKALNQYLPKIINSGYCAVIVDQLEDPRLAKGIVKRGVTRIVTPGTLDGENAPSVKNSYLVSFFKQKNTLGISLCDISTGEFMWTQTDYTKENISHVLSSYEPVEVLLWENEKDISFSTLPVQFIPKGIENIKYSESKIKDFFSIKSINSLGLDGKDSATISVAMVLSCIEETQLMDPKHIQKPSRFSLNGSMILDRATIRNLELVASAYNGDVKESLFGVIDKTNTPMGKRLLYSWLLNPLIEKKEIDERLEVVNSFFTQPKILEDTRESFSNINDIERIVGKIGLKRANARDLKALQLSLDSISILIKEKLKDGLSKYLNEYTELLSKVTKEIEECIIDEPPTSLSEGHIIKETFNDEVKELRTISGDSKDWLKGFVEKEKKKTSISNLKVGFNNVFGYYLEVTKAQQSKVPERYIRKQTLVNCERYITEELKEKESIILNSQEKLCSLEYLLFEKFRDSLVRYIPQLQIISKEIARLDILSGFAYLSINSNYVKPTIYEMGEKEGILKIVAGRHPIVEMITEEDFISNDTYLDFEKSSMAILTGPNMSGKSTYIRQVATITLLAQIGCFVPAKSFELSIVDRIFTRVGASDDLSRGRSTFMVEMDEAANIVNNATKYSLVVLDEIGRGTSTYDGVSIAWSLAEFLARDIRARTLFATHYHELLKLSEKIPDRVKNYNVLVQEDIAEGTVIFLRKIVEGGTDRSYGIYVAKMAGLPDKVIKRATEILENFEQEQMFTKESSVRGSSILQESAKESNEVTTSFQFPLFGTSSSEIEKEIIEMDLDNLTPMEALNKIASWKKKI